MLEQDLIQNGFEEKVTVNQRALIDKLLARYKGNSLYSLTYNCRPIHRISRVDTKRR
jgi:hypothetical protein